MSALRRFDYRHREDAVAAKIGALRLDGNRKVGGGGNGRGETLT